MRNLHRFITNPLGFSTLDILSPHGDVGMEKILFPLQLGHHQQMLRKQDKMFMMDPYVVNRNREVS